MTLATDNCGGVQSVTNNLASLPLTLGINNLIWTARDFANNTATYTQVITVTNPVTVVTVAPAAVCSPSKVNLTESSVTTGSTSGLTFTYFTDAAATIALVDPTMVATSGTYYIKGTNVNGCSDVKPITVVVNAPPVATIIPPVSTILTCAAPSIALSAMTSTGFYAWRNGATTVSNVASFTATTIGTYVLTITNSNACTVTASIVITEDIVAPIPTITGGGTTICSGSSISLTAVGTGISSYLWSGPNSFSSSSTTDPSVTILNAQTTATGIYTLTVAYANGCTATSSTSVTVNQTPVATITNNNGLALNCTTTSTTLTATGGGTYLWGTGETTSTLVVSTAGTFNVVVSMGGCTSSASVTTTLDNATPTTSITNNNGLALSCSTPSTTLTATGLATSYLWTGGSTASTLTVNVAGDYTVTATGANGCTATASVAVSLNNTIPSVTISGNTALSCTTPSTTLVASGTHPSYVWTGGTTGNSLEVTTAGTFVVTVTAANGCIATARVTTTLDNLAPIAIITNSGLELNCITTSTLLTATGTGTSYLWTGGSTASTLSVMSAGTYMVTVSTANGCTSTSSVVITESKTIPSASITPSAMALTCSAPTATCASDSFKPWMAAFSEDFTLSKEPE